MQEQWSLGLGGIYVPMGLVWLGTQMHRVDGEETVAFGAPRWGYSVDEVERVTLSLVGKSATQSHAFAVVVICRSWRGSLLSLVMRGGTIARPRCAKEYRPCVVRLPVSWERVRRTWRAHLGVDGGKSLPSIVLARSRVVTPTCDIFLGV